MASTNAHDKTAFNQCWDNGNSLCISQERRRNFLGRDFHNLFQDLSRSLNDCYLTAGGIEGDGLGEIIAIVLGLSLGSYSGWKRGGPVDYFGNGLSLILYSMPYFLIGMLLLLVFATTLGWFPTSGMFTIGATYASPAEQLADFCRHLVLPVATVALGLIGQYSILTRSSIVETLSEDYVGTARAKGIPEGRILRTHALPNALLPTVTLIAINLGYVVAGAITVEVVFNWPGIGTLTVDALAARDYPVLQGVFLILSVAVVVANLAADIVYGFLDPRVRT